MKPTIDDSTVKEFKKDVKKLYKKYRNLEEDLKRAIKVLKAEPINESRAPQIAHVGKEVRIPVYKLKKFRSIDFRGKGAKSGFRLIYAYDSEKNRIILVEMYHKSKKGKEDRGRILKYFKGV